MKKHLTLLFTTLALTHISTWAHDKPPRRSSAATASTPVNTAASVPEADRLAAKAAAAIADREASKKTPSRALDTAQQRHTVVKRNKSRCAIL